MATKTFKIGLSDTDKANMAQSIYEQVIALEFNEYDSNNTYNAGDYVVYDDTLYKCIATTSGIFDSGDWQETTIESVTNDIVDGKLTNYYTKSETTSLYVPLSRTIAGIDLQDNISKSEIVDAITDASLDGTSNNPVKNSAIVNALALKLDKANVKNTPSSTLSDSNVLSEKYSEENYVKHNTYDGTLSVKKADKADIADNLTPYSDESGANQDEPFSYQATGTANGSQSDFATGSYCLLKEKQGNTVVVNQLWQPEPSHTIYGITCTNNNDGTVTLNGTASDSGSLGTGMNISVIQGHKYLIFEDSDYFKNSHTLYSTIRGNEGISNNAIITADSSGNKIVSVRTDANEVFSSQKVNTKVINLTQWFGGNDNIPSDLLSHSENFFRYYQGDLSYNAATLLSANSRYLKTIGRNQYDGEHDVKVIPNNNYYIYGSATLTYKDKDGNTIDSESKTNETFNVPSSCLSVGVSGSGNIGIYIYYEGESGYDQYYPYKVLSNVDTGTEELRSSGSIRDYKTPDGVVHKMVGNYVFTGNEIWNWNQSNEYWYLSISLFSPMYKFNGQYTTSNGIYCNLNDSSFRVYIRDNPQITSSTNMNTVFANGVVMNYELATPTTQQGTPFSENLTIDDFGSMEFSDTSGVPQGNLIFYPVDYKAFVDTLYNTVRGDGTNILSKEGENESLPLGAPETLKQLLDYVDGLYAIEQENIGGTLRHQLVAQVTAGGGTLDFADTAWVDFYSLNWSYNSTYGVFYSTGLASLIKSNGVILCPLYKYTNEFMENMNNMEISTRASFSTGNIVVKNTSYTNTTAFKNAMRGILFAYEKANE